MNSIISEVQACGIEEKVSIGVLQVDHSYQREVKAHHRKITKNWDPRAAGRLTVSRRPNGTMWIIDGQQRVAAMKKLGITEWLAVVIHTKGPEEEAILFNRINGGEGSAKALSYLEIFKAQIESKDPIALAVMQGAHKYGLQIITKKSGHYQQKKWPHLVCIKTCYETVRKFGYNIYDTTLRVITTAWPQNDYTLDAAIIHAMATLLTHEEVDPDRMVKLCRDTNPLTLVQQNQAFGMRGMNSTSTMYVLLVRIYNKHRKNRIPEEMPKSRTTELWHISHKTRKEMEVNGEEVGKE